MPKESALFSVAVAVATLFGFNWLRVCFPLLDVAFMRHVQRRKATPKQQQSIKVHSEAVVEATGLEVRPSMIPGAGNGLFSVRAFKQGDVICHYFGDLLTDHVGLCSFALQSVKCDLCAGNSTE